MKKLGFILICLGLMSSCKNNTSTTSASNSATNNIPSDSLIEKKQVPWQTISTDEERLATALLSAPKGSRDNCKVIAYNEQGEISILREGSNEFIVLADDPREPGFSAACYHKDLEPFMARGRKLKAEGKSYTEIFDIREAEAKSGELDMGPPGTTLHIYYGDSDRYNPETYEVENAVYRYVVYLPFATSETTGLPEVPIASNHPWIMNPGTHRAHIMISPNPESID